MNQELLDLLEKNGIKVDLPESATPEQIKELTDQVKALQSQRDAEDAAKKADDKIQAPNVHIKGDGEGKEAGLRHLQDAFGLQTNTPMHTTRTGYGEELVPSDNLSSEIMDIAPTYETFLANLPGNHGNDLELTETVPIIGEEELFKAGSEKTADSAFAVEKGTTQIPTDKIQIAQKQLYATVDITDFLRKFNVKRADRFEQLVKEKLAKGWSRTKEALILNGDTETGATGNVNSDDGAPAAGTYYLEADGLRKTAIGMTSPNGDPDLGTLDIADFRTLENVLGNYFADPTQCSWLINLKTKTKARGLQQFYDASVRGEKTTVAGKDIDSFDGSPIFVPRDFGLTEADGKISTTPANNTKGGIILLYNPAVQYGTHGDLQFKLYDYGRQGIQLEVWGYFGFNIINQKAGVTDGFVANGINITV